MKQKKVLLVEDDRLIRESMHEALEFEGYDVITAINGKDALGILTGLSKENHPHIILLDLMMPVMDGQQFMKSIETDYKSIFDLIPIIVLSAQSNLALTGHKAPAAILKKPMNLDELFNQIQTILN